MTADGLMYPKGISVVVPTEGRVGLTLDLLRGLATCRDQFAFPCEVLIVDSSNEEDRKAITRACRQFEARLLRGSRNVREKRNRGLKNAQYSVVLFVDSDCRPAPDLLSEHWRCYQDVDESNLGGVLGRTVFYGPETWIWRMVRGSSMVRHFTMAVRKATTSWGPTANISFRRKVLKQVGSFDLDFPFRLGGDDLDLSYRVVQAGFVLLCNPSAVVYHSRSTWNSFVSVIGRALRWGRMEYFLYRKHSAARVWAPPSYWGWTMLVWVLFCLQAVMTKGATPIILFPIWALLSLFLFSLLSVIHVRDSSQDT